MTLRETDDFQEGVETSGGSGAVVLEKPVAPNTTVVTPAQEAIAASGLGSRKALLLALLADASREEITEANATSAIGKILKQLQAMADADMVTVLQAGSYTALRMAFDDHMRILSNLWKRPTVEQAQQLQLWKSQYDDARKAIHGKPVNRNVPGGEHVQAIM